MKYPYLLLDADNTLFDFDAGNRLAVTAVCRRFDIPDTEESFRLYEGCNNALWAAFDRGEVTKDFLVVQRFRDFFRKLGIERDAAACNEVHLAVLSENTLLMPHALEVCRELHKTHKLYIVTNAVAAVQRSRLGKSALAPYIDGAFISEEAGASKPSREYFDYVFAHVEGLRRDNCLLIGDSLSSDMQGAANYGLPSCWYNPGRLPRPADLDITYTIDDLRQLPDIV